MKNCCALLAVLASALTCTAQQAEEPIGIVTIFREHATSRLKMFSMKDQWPARLHLKMVLDRKSLVDMHGQEFVSFKLPAGRHVVEFENGTGASVSFELHPNERVFVRPGFMGGQFVEAARTLMTVVPCTEAIDIGKDAQPMPAKHILRADPLLEDHFPSSCVESSEAH